MSSRGLLLAAVGSLLMPDSSALGWTVADPAAQITRPSGEVACGLGHGVGS